jgi:hypothetical protein
MSMPDGSLQCSKERNSFSQREERIKKHLHDIADMVKIMDHKVGNVMEYPVASENLEKVKEQLQKVIKSLDENIEIIKRYWEAKDKWRLQDALKEFQKFEIIYDDHGWRSDVIKVRFHHSCDLLVWYDKDNEKLIRYRCMCLHEKEGTSENLAELIEKYSTHNCVPWGA